VYNCHIFDIYKTQLHHIVKINVYVIGHFLIGIDGGMFYFCSVIRKFH